MEYNIKLNSIYAFSKVFSAEHIKLFAELSEDNNPIHIDETYASQTVFKKTVVHGVLLVSMFSKIFGTIYPGEGGIYLSQTARFLKPVFVGEMATAKATLIQFDKAKKRGTFLTECFKENGQLAFKGEAIILFPSHFELI